MNKKIILISLIFIILILIGIFVYLNYLKKPAPVETPEVPKFSSCVVLDEEHCKKGEALYNENNEFVGIGFSLPEGTKIYAPFDGLLDNVIEAEIFKGALHAGFEISDDEDELRGYFNVFGGVKTTILPEEPIFSEEPERLLDEPVEKGQLVATVTGDKKIVTPDGEKDYDIAIDFVVVDFRDPENIKSHHNIEFLQTLFDYIKIE